MATRLTAFGGFDHGIQFFTVRDARLRLALLSASAQAAVWDVSLVSVLDELGHHAMAAPAARGRRWVATGAWGTGWRALFCPV